ncbi:MAG: GTPase Era [Candidatus Promineifilaceae bacterium]
MSDFSKQENEKDEFDELLPEGHRSGFVAVVGRPNVGKSTLINQFMREKIAIASPRPQTTRIRQLGIITEPHYQMIFMDTPGLIGKPRHKLDEFMKETALDTLADADIILWLVDVSEAPGGLDRDIAAELKRLPPETKIVLVLNKSDLPDPITVPNKAEPYKTLLPDASWIVISALTGQNCDVLLDKLAEGLPLGPRYYPADQATDMFVRDIAGEMIREQIFLQLREEIPYGTAVQIDQFKEREGGAVFIQATIFVERDTHKKIIIGQKGEQLRQIGAAARKEIETLVEGAVYLDLWVKVEPKWRQSERQLQRFGYARPKG